MAFAPEEETDPGRRGDSLCTLQKNEFCLWEGVFLAPPRPKKPAWREEVFCSPFGGGAKKASAPPTRGKVVFRGGGREKRLGQNGGFPEPPVLKIQFPGGGKAVFFFGGHGKKSRA